MKALILVPAVLAIVLVGLYFNRINEQHQPVHLYYDTTFLPSKCILITTKYLEGDRKPSMLDGVIPIEDPNHRALMEGVFLGASHVVPTENPNEFSYYECEPKSDA